MIIDCHAHFDPRMLDTGRMLAKMDAAKVDRVALIPAMNDPIGGGSKRSERTLGVFRWLMEHRASRPLAELAHRSFLTPEGDFQASGRVFQIYSRPDNEGIAALLKQHPDRFFGWMFLNPRNNPAVLDELERWRQVKGMIGVKLHPHWHDYRTEILSPLLKRCEELKLPTLIHLGFRKRGDFRSIAEAFPRLVIISAHAGFPFYKDLWAYKHAYPNLHVDLSSPYINERLARKAVEAMGPERCLYGTDSPYGFHEQDGSYDYGEIRGWVERMPVQSEQVERMLGGNFRTILSGSGVEV